MLPLTLGSNLHLESPKPLPLLTPTLPPPLIGPRPDPEEEETNLLTAKLIIKQHFPAAPQLLQPPAPELEKGLHCMKGSPV